MTNGTGSDSDHEEEHPTDDMATPETQAMMMMLQMQQQQMEMQKQMTHMMSRLISKDDSTGFGSVAPPHTDTRTQRLKLERPTIEADSTDHKWVIFTDAWARYKEMAKLNNLNDIRNELRSTCSSSVNEMLFNFVGPDSLKNADEEQLLRFIKSVAVKSVHPEVYRQQFFVMTQSDGETITCFISRLKSQAMLCDFRRKCDCTGEHCLTSYSEDMIRSQLIAGVRNASHQCKVLSEMQSLKTLQQLTERLLTLESTEKASSHFRPTYDLPGDSRMAPIKSEYQRRKSSQPIRPTQHSKPNQILPKTQQTPCRGCGRPWHQNGRRQCPANGQKCNKCGKLNHFAAVCLSSSTAAIHEDEHIQCDEGVSFLSTITSPKPL